MAGSAAGSTRANLTQNRSLQRVSYPPQDRETRSDHRIAPTEPPTSLTPMIFPRRLSQPPYKPFESFETFCKNPSYPSCKIFAAFS